MKSYVFGPYCFAFGLNTKIYRINLRTQSEHGKIRPCENSIFGRFSCSEPNWHSLDKLPLQRCLKTYLDITFLKYMILLSHQGSKLLFNSFSLIIFLQSLENQINLVKLNFYVPLKTLSDSFWYLIIRSVLHKKRVEQ